MLLCCLLLKDRNTASKNLKGSPVSYKGEPRNLLALLVYGETAHAGIIGAPGQRSIYVPFVRFERCLVGQEYIMTCGLWTQFAW